MLDVRPSLELWNQCLQRPSDGTGWQLVQDRIDARMPSRRLASTSIDALALRLGMPSRRVGVPIFYLLGPRPGLALRLPEAPVDTPGTELQPPGPDVVND